MPPRLYSLELHGFKTFANRAFFEFADTVTAVVGPNGSGKSNIADCLRWVLGEQSYALLRGKKTEDMIFAGSESRPRAGMASATITFDNSEGWLPIEFSEVAITRRAYRDGLNEYQINGRRVRLKDVSELLAQSGLAERTYTFIGQGLVDAALSLKADERRRLFEEAAGIGLHRSRLEEALRRLDATRRNLERVEDILAELKPRLSSLERQARRAAEYEQLRTDLHVLLREWYGYHWHLAQRELAESRSASSVQEMRVEKIRLEQVEIEGRSAALRRELSAARAELGEWHKELSALHARRETASRELAVLAERLDAISSQESGLISEAARLEEELGLAGEAVQAALAEIQGLEAELEEAAGERDAAQAVLAARRAERSEIEQQISGLRQEIAGLNSKLGRLQALNAETQAAVERAQKALDGADSAQAEAERSRQIAAARYAEASAVTAQRDQASKAAEEALTLHRKKIESVEAERRRFETARSAAAAELSRLTASQEVLEQAEASLAGYAAGARTLLTAANERRLNGARGALSSHLEVPADLEKAIAAALGEYLDALLMDEDPDPALDLLNTQTGRGVVLPVGALRPPKDRSHLGDRSGVLGLASGLVRCPPELQAVVDLLLGRVWIVRDRGAARGLLADLPAGGRAVTLNGEVFHAGGAITAGGGEGTQGNLLSRARRRRELVAQRLDYEKDLSRFRQQLAVLDSDLGRLRTEEKTLSTEFESVRRETQQAARLEDKARAAVETAEGRLAWSAEQYARLQSDLEHGRARGDQLAAERVEADARLAEVRQLLQAETRRLESLELDDLQTQAAHWITRLAVAERACSDARARLDERRERMRRVGAGIAALDTRRAGLVEARASGEAQIAGLRVENEALAAQIRQQNARIEPAEAALTAMQTEADRLQATEADARQNLSLADHVFAQTRITLARRQESLASLQRRIEEDFGLVAFEYEEKVSGPTPLPLTGLVEQLPIVRKLTPEIEENIKRQRAQLRRVGAVNPDAQAEYNEVKQRFQFLTTQVGDLNRAEADIRQVIAELETMIQREFRRTFDAVAEEFRQTFTRLFGGGSARLILTDPDDLGATGIDIQARLPGRRAQGLALLSGGERSLTAVALVFSLLKVSPTPFCVLDEVDAMLDEMNVGRFRELLRELSATTQFVIITHNRNTVQAADVIYGITMGRDSASQVLSLRLDEVSQIVE